MGKDRLKVVIVMCPSRGSDPASGHPRVQKLALGRVTPPPVWGVHLDAPGQWQGQIPSAVWTQSSETGTGALLAQPTKGKEG